MARETERGKNVEQAAEKKSASIDGCTCPSYECMFNQSGCLSAMMMLVNGIGRKERKLKIERQRVKKERKGEKKKKKKKKNVCSLSRLNLTQRCRRPL
jgi:hypothetical protein